MPMPDFEAMYDRLFNKITDAVRILQQAQQERETEFIESEDGRLLLLQTEDEEA